jgi:hypothetical protein
MMFSWESLEQAFDGIWKGNTKTLQNLLVFVSHFFKQTCGFWVNMEVLLVDMDHA